jgi:hypothetical protein
LSLSCEKSLAGVGVVEEEEEEKGVGLDLREEVGRRTERQQPQVE